MGTPETILQHIVTQFCCLYIWAHQRQFYNI